MGNCCSGEREQSDLDARKSMRIEVQRFGKSGPTYQTDFMSQSDAIERIRGDLYSEVDLPDDGNNTDWEDTEHIQLGR